MKPPRPVESEIRIISAIASMIPLDPKLLRTIIMIMIKTENINPVYTPYLIFSSLAKYVAIKPPIINAKNKITPAVLGPYKHWAYNYYRNK